MHILVTHEEIQEMIQKLTGEMHAELGVSLLSKISKVVLPGFGAGARKRASPPAFSSFLDDPPAMKSFMRPYAGDEERAPGIKLNLVSAGGEQEVIQVNIVELK